MYIEGTNLLKRGNSSDSSTSENLVTYNHTPGRDPFKSVDQSYPLTVDMNEFSGRAIPNFRRRQNSGELLPHTPWYKLNIKGSTEGYYNVYNKNGIHLYDTNQHGHINGTGWIITKDEIEALAPTGHEVFTMEAAAKIYSQGFDVLTFVAEFKDVVRMFRSIAKRITRLKIPKRSLNISTLEALKSPTSDYLSLRYGYRPLLNDMVNMLEAINNWKKIKDRYSMNAGLASQYSVTTETMLYWSYFSVIQCITDQVVIRQRGSVTADIDIPTLQFNPLVTGWEVIPFSFVVDWFVNVGKSLAALSFAGKVKNYAASKGYKIEVDRTFSREFGTPTPIYASGDFWQYGSCTASLEVRQPCRISYFPRLVVRLDAWKVIDALSLILQRL